MQRQSGVLVKQHSHLRISSVESFDGKLDWADIVSGDRAFEDNLILLPRDQHPVRALGLCGTKTFLYPATALRVT